MFNQGKLHPYKAKLFIFIYLCIVLIPNFISITSILNLTTKLYLDPLKAATVRVNEENLNISMSTTHVSRMTKAISSNDRGVKIVKKGIGLDFIIVGYPKCGTSALR